MRRLLDSVRGWGALPWLGLAWLAGQLPGPTATGTTGQPVGGLWWWHVAAGLLVVVAVVGAIRAGDVAERIDRAAVGVWSSTRRWTSTVVVGWLVLAVLAAVQWLDGGAVRAQLASFVAAAAIVALGRRRTVGGAAVGHLAVGTALLAVGTLVAFAVVVLGQYGPPPALPLVGDAPGVADPGGQFAFYRIKQQVRVTVAAHNVLAGFLLAGAPAVALATIRRPRRWWPWLVVVGLALGATLSRGALVAGGIAVVVAWLLRDRTTARRLGVVVVLGAIGTGVALAQLGAAVPDPEGPTSVVARTELWAAAWDAFTDEPLTGIGLDGLREHTAERGGTVHEHAHSLPLHALATLGVPGLLAVLAVWGGIVVAGARQLDRDRRTVVLVGMAGLGALAMVDEVALRPATIGLLALLALVATSPREPG